MYAYTINIYKLELFNIGIGYKNIIYTYVHCWCWYMLEYGKIYRKNPGN